MGERSSTPPAMNKAQVRVEMMQRREALTSQERRRLSELACAALVGSEPFQRAGLVFLYCAMGEEIATDPLVKGAIAAGKRLVLPRVQKRPKALILHHWSGDHGDLVRSAYGIEEPHPDAPQAALSAIDLIVVPGLAFDLTGARLGYGGGYYDRTLPLIRKANPAVVAVGFCYGFQVVDHLATEPHDQHVDGVATDHGVHWVESR